MDFIAFNYRSQIYFADNGFAIGVVNSALYTNRLLLIVKLRPNYLIFMVNVCGKTDLFPKIMEISGCISKVDLVQEVNMVIWMRKFYYITKIVGCGSSETNN